MTLVNSVNPASIIDFLFQEAVISHDEISALRKSKDDPKQQTRDLLNQLHASENPQAFVHLYLAIKQEPHLQWLTERIDNFTDQSLIDLLQQLYLSEPTGECVLNKIPGSKRGNTTMEPSPFPSPPSLPLSIIPLFRTVLSIPLQISRSFPSLISLNLAVGVKRSVLRSVSGVLVESGSKHNDNVGHFVFV